MDKETLHKFAFEPGLLSIESTEKVEKFLTNLFEEYKIYSEVFRDSNLIEGLIKKAKWYIEFKKNNPNHGDHRGIQ